MQLASFPLNLPAPLLRALGELEALPDGLQGLDTPEAEAFWMRLAEHLQHLEGVAEGLPEDLDTTQLAALLAAGLDGEELPQDGEPLPVTVPVIQPQEVSRALGRTEPQGGSAASVRDQLLASLPLLASQGDREGGRAVPLPQALGALVDAVAAGSRSEAPPVPVAAAIVASADAATSGQQPQQSTQAMPRVFQLDVPMHQPGWDRALGDRVQWMVRENIQVAELRLNPPNLGPIEVRLHVEGDRTHVNFLAPQAAVREAIDAALPRLRELFAEGGVQLGDVTVSHQDARQAGGDAGQDAGHRGESGSVDDEGEGAMAQSDAPRRGAGLVDYYA
ncbi:hypothetical protein B1C78_05145 [Thioalkalivibrio denitrificans]|uniref:Flagellar hook-length control protein-like C-terminal domain-containing protein n=2 Tax=Thioalkalivibrio denitrificans TaxID=108003 RepID=A0A1V3NN85_9GAMM|nr:hypothetical protein B1C78_05145 [Thioalkalivibrio denitrificans]